MSSPFLKRFNCEWVNEIAVVLAVIFCAYSIYHSYQQAIHFKTEIIRISQKQVDAVAEQAKQQLEAIKEQEKKLKEFGGWLSKCGEQMWQGKKEIAELPILLNRKK